MSPAIVNLLQRRNTESAGLAAALGACALLLAGCSTPQDPLEIRFQLRYGDRSLSCADNGAGIALTDLRFYVHDLRMLGADGEEHAVSLLPDSLWQSEEVALLDFESGDGNCRNGTRETNTVLRGRVQSGSYRGLKFRVGVPEHLNHADPLSAASPLGYSFMHWHWSTGYKFLRAGIAGERDGFWIHLGSTRCEGTARQVKGCRSANRPAIELAEFSPREQAIVVDLERLLEGIDLADGRPTDCSSGPAEDECRAPFTALGLDFQTGEAASEAVVFRVGRLQ